MVESMRALKQNNGASNAAKDQLYRNEGVVMRVLLQQRHFAVPMGEPGTIGRKAVSCLLFACTRTIDIDLNPPPAGHVAPLVHSSGPFFHISCAK